MTEGMDMVSKEPELMKLMRIIQMISSEGDLPTLDLISERSGIEHEKVLFRITKLVHGGLLSAEEWHNGERKMVYHLTTPGRDLLRSMEKETF